MLEIGNGLHFVIVQGVSIFFKKCYIVVSYVPVLKGTQILKKNFLSAMSHTFMDWKSFA